MSCMIQKKENTAILAAYITNLLNYKGRHPYNCPELLSRELIDCYEDYYYQEDKVYQRLRQMNIDAYCVRYKARIKENGIETEMDRIGIELTEDISGYKIRLLDISHPDEWGDGYYIVKEWHYRILKILIFYLYQCAEGDIPDSKLYKALIEVKCNLTSFIATNNSTYHNIDWE